MKQTSKEIIDYNRDKLRYTRILYGDLSELAKIEEEALNANLEPVRDSQIENGE